MWNGEKFSLQSARWFWARLARCGLAGIMEGNFPCCGRLRSLPLFPSWCHWLHNAKLRWLEVPPIPLQFPQQSATWTVAMTSLMKVRSSVTSTASTTSCRVPAVASLCAALSLSYPRPWICHRTGIPLTRGQIRVAPHLVYITACSHCYHCHTRGIGAHSLPMLSSVATGDKASHLAWWLLTSSAFWTVGIHSRLM